MRHFLSGYDATSDYVEEATYEAASLELATPGFFTATYTAQERKVLTEVKGIKWTVVQGEADRAEAWANATPVSTRIESMLSPYMSTRRRVGFTVLNAPA